MINYIHLHNHTHYSLLDGACTVDGLVGAAKGFDMPAVALTDHGVLFGSIEFYKKAKNFNVKPILGCEAYIVTRGSRFDKEATGTDKEFGKKRRYHHILLLAKDEAGYKNLIKISSAGYTEGFYYKPRIDLEVLRNYKDGLIAMSACAGGIVGAHLVNDDFNLAMEDASIYKDIFGDDFYLEMQNHYMAVEKNIIENLPKVSKELNIKIVATNDCHYIRKEDAIAHNIYLLIPESSNNNPLEYKKLKYGTDQVYFKSQDEMEEAFSHYPEALENTLEVADKCNLKLDLKKNYMPNFPLPEDSKAKTLDDYFEELCWEGLQRIFPEITPELNDRLAFEIKIIRQMGYAGYFLIVQDFINKAKEMGISVGPGRGSAAGSLASYTLGITNLNPLDYDLLFERFLNPDRVSMPDIDVDFADDRRGEIINYVREKYGTNSVGQIITFGKLSSRAVLKDVGRVLGVPLGTIEQITKQIPVVQGKVTPIKEAIETIPELKWVKESTDEKVKELVEYSITLENLNRNASTHAAGVVIVPGNLVDYVPLYKNSNMAEAVTQYNMKDLETAGLLKMDFLGLKTLTIIENIKKLVKKNYNLDINIDHIPLNDVKTYELFGKGQTVGVFQFESAPMQEYLKKLKPNCIDDLVAMNALYRPGPMDMIDDFIARKHGKQKIEYLHSAMAPILKNTYGIIVFQEQVMQIVSKLAGFSLAGADLLRRAMGKKDTELMARQKNDFVEGAAKNGIDKKIANEIFDMIEKFAKYGFNKSHSVAYSLVAYQTAYLKANYPVEFMAANLLNEIGNTDKIVLFIDDCRKMNIKVLPPDVNEKESGFVCKNNEIRFGLEAIKNVGTTAVQEIIISVNKNGKYKDIFHFCESVDLRVVNRKTIESLVLAGAMDEFGNNRRQLYEVVDKAIQFGQNGQTARLMGQESLFGGSKTTETTSSVSVYPALPQVNDWGVFERLGNEKSVLGFYLSGHPLDKYKESVESFNNFQLGNLENFKEDSVIRVLGIITSIRTKIDKRGNLMAFFTLEDFSGKGDCLAFSDTYSKFQELIKQDAIIGVIGKGKSAGDKISILVNEVLPVEKIKSNKAINIKLFVEVNTSQELMKIKPIIEKNPGTCPLFFKVINGSLNDAKTFKVKKYFVNPTHELMNELKIVFGKENIEYTEK